MRRWPRPLGMRAAFCFSQHPLGSGLRLQQVPWLHGHWDQVMKMLARSKASHALFYGVVLGAIFAAAVWFNVLNLVTLVGASGETAELAASYLRIIIPSLPILVASIIASAVLRSHGAASSSMYVTILGGVVNAILDPIFMFALDMNLAGAAWASVAALIASASLSFYFLFKNHGGLEAPDRVGLLRDFNPVMVIAIPAILTQLATPVAQPLPHVPCQNSVRRPLRAWS